MYEMPENCKWIHQTLEDLPLIEYPFDVDKLPDNAIYFFYEKGEYQSHNHDSPRIVRVGTHRDGNFKKRITQHYALNDSKLEFDARSAAPHRWSVFRKNIGRALLNKNGNKDYLDIWDKKFTEKETIKEFSHLRDVELEKRTESEVTRIIRKSFSFRFLNIENQDERINLESKLIATLAQCNICKPSENWLGLHSPINAIRTSGLWQTQHLDSEPINENDKEKIR